MEIDDGSDETEINDRNGSSEEDSDIQVIYAHLCLS